MDPPEHIASREEKTYRSLVVNPRRAIEEKGSRAGNEWSPTLLGFSTRVIESIQLVAGYRPFSALISNLGTPLQLCGKLFGNNPMFPPSSLIVKAQISP